MEKPIKSYKTSLQKKWISSPGIGYVRERY